MSQLQSKEKNSKMGRILKKRREEELIMKNKTKILAFDSSQLESEMEGIAYYRISPHFRDFLTKCFEKHGIIGFSYEKNSLNFGILIGMAEDEEELK